MNSKRFGAIDIGSNSVKLLICDLIDYKDRIVSKKFVYTRVPLQLGNDAFQLGYISDKKKEKLAQLIQTFKSIIEISNTEDFRVCATSALREASNKTEIINFVYLTTGVRIELISTKEEAYFIFLGGTDKNYSPEVLHILVDVGGGCTEIVLSQNNMLLDEKSFNLGTIRVLSKQQEIEEWEKLKKWLENIRHNPRNVFLVGSGGNINKINSLYRKGKIRKTDLKNFHRKLKNMDYEERVIHSNFNLNRAKVILPAINIYFNIMKILKIEVLHIPMIGIADGIIRDLYNEKSGT